jgi:hypothetical protein
MMKLAICILFVAVLGFPALSGAAEQKYRRACVDVSGPVLKIVDDSLCDEAPAAVAPGCDDLKTFEKLAGMAEAEPQARADLTEAWNTLCSLPSQTGRTVRYANGQVATNHYGQPGATWYYPNGHTVTTHPGETGATWYYSNGHTITNHADQEGATWYYANGRTATNHYGQIGATWYYDNGNVVTNHAGQRGATWYYANGKTLSSQFGQSGATWYYPNGTVWQSSGQALSEGQLLDVPGIMTMILNAVGH